VIDRARDHVGGVGRAKGWIVHAEWSRKIPPASDHPGMRWQPAPEFEKRRERRTTVTPTRQHLLEGGNFAKTPWLMRLRSATEALRLLCVLDVIGRPAEGRPDGDSVPAWMPIGRPWPLAAAKIAYAGSQRHLAIASTGSGRNAVRGAAARSRDRVVTFCSGTTIEARRPGSRSKPFCCDQKMARAKAAPFLVDTSWTP